MRTLRSASLLALLLTTAPAFAQPGGLDTRLTMRARQTLQQDPALAILPELRVTVRNGVATLWGAVPNSDIARRAETMLRQLTGVTEVCNDLHVQSPTDPMVAFLKQGEGDNGRAWIMTNRPAALMSRPEDEPGADKGVALLLPPISLQAAPAAPVDADPATALTRLRQAEPRFHGVQAEVRGGIVWLRPVNARAEDVFELARIASTLRGVERVIVQDR